jgi:ssDNA-binding Zn-finger/Zn-ribbon topoisomerase 1
MARTYSPTIIDYPDCRKCGIPTRTLHIEPGKAGYEKRTFICYECNHSEIVFVKYK